MRKTKYYLSLSAAESRLALTALLCFRNKTLTKRINTVDIDRLIRKLIRKKGWWF